MKQGAIDPWAVRAHVYATVAGTGRFPTAAESAAALGITGEDALAAYRALHDAHALFLDADGETIRMASPFSGVPTPFVVEIGGVRCWANCAWDMLGIPAAVGQDARIHAAYAEDGAPAELAVEAGRIRGDGGLVHILLPLRRWYDDLVFT